MVLLRLREISEVFPPSLRSAGFRALELATHLGQPDRRSAGRSAASETTGVRPCAVAGWVDLAFVLRGQEQVISPYWRSEIAEQAWELADRRASA